MGRSPTTWPTGPACGARTASKKPKKPSRRPKDQTQLHGAARVRGAALTKNQNLQNRNPQSKCAGVHRRRFR